MRDGNGMIHPLLHSQKLSFILRVKFQVLCTLNKQRWWRGLINLETLGLQINKPVKGVKTVMSAQLWKSWHFRYQLNSFHKRCCEKFVFVITLISINCVLSCFSSGKWSDQNTQNLHYHLMFSRQKAQTLLCQVWKI